MNAVNLAENGIIPIFLIRAGIRMRLKKKLDFENSRGVDSKQRIIEKLRSSPIAIATNDANDQHYEVPTSFYQSILGPKLKYSACYWPEGVRSLKQAEEASLNQVIARAEIADNMQVLELGCGWGSFSLWAAEKFPKSNFTAVSNSSTQAEYIREQAEKKNINNLVVLTENMLHFQPTHQFNRIVSIEMFEHMRNYEQLFHNISGWLTESGKLFAHVFSHKSYAYLYESEDESDWMSNYFFTGGVMPSQDLFSHFNDDLKIEEDWHMNGQHYSQTLEAWLHNLHENEEEIMAIFSEHYGEIQSKIWVNRWKMFILACSELFAYEKGNEWGVSHYRFTKAH